MPKRRKFRIGEIVRCKTTIDGYIIKGRIQNLFIDGTVAVRFDDYTYNDGALGFRCLDIRALRACVINDDDDNTQGLHAELPGSNS